MEWFIEAQVNLLTFCAQKFAQDTMKPLLFLLLYMYGIAAVYGKYDYAGLFTCQLLLSSNCTTYYVIHTCRWQCICQPPTEILVVHACYDSTYMHVCKYATEYLLHLGNIASLWGASLTSACTVVFFNHIHPW